MNLKSALTLRSTAIGLCLLIAAPGAMGGALAMAPLIGLAGPLAAPWPSLHTVARKGGLPLALFAAFILWTLLTSLWAPPNNGRIPFHLTGSIVTGLLFAAAAGFRPERADSAFVRAAALVFICLTTALGLIEFIGHLPLNRLASPREPLELLIRAPWKGTAVLVTCTWGVAAMLWARGGRPRMSLGALLVAIGLTAFLSDKSANMLAFAVGLIGFAAGLAFKHNAFRVSANIAAAWMLGAPAMMTWMTPVMERLPLPASWLARAGIWRQAAAEVPDKMPFGAGLGAFRALARPQEVDGAGTFQAMHPHSASLQIWYETGLIGALLAAAALAALAEAGSRALKDNGPGSAAAAGTICAGAVIAYLSYGLWEEWWVATLFAAGGLAAAAIGFTRAAHPAANRAAQTQQQAGQ